MSDAGIAGRVERVVAAERDLRTREQAECDDPGERLTLVAGDGGLLMVALRARVFG
jgi:hypothetical protein